MDRALAKANQIVPLVRMAEALTGVDQRNAAKALEANDVVSTLLFMLQLHRTTIEDLKPGANKDAYKRSHKYCETRFNIQLRELNVVIAQAKSPGLVAEVRDVRQAVREALNLLYETRL